MDSPKIIKFSENYSIENSRIIPIPFYAKPLKYWIKFEVIFKLVITWYKMGESIERNEEVLFSFTNV